MKIIPVHRRIRLHYIEYHSMIEYITTEEDGFLHGLLVRLTLLAADFGDKLMHHVNGQKTGRRSDA